MVKGKRKDGKNRLVPCKARFRSAQQAIIHLLQYGKTDAEIIPQITEEYGYSEVTVQEYINDAKKIVEKKYERYTDQISYRNKCRLEALISECIDTDDKKYLIEALKELNKMTGQYETKIKVDGNGDFKIKIGKE